MKVLKLHVMIVSQQVQQDMSWSNTYGHHCVRWIWGRRVGLSYLKHSTCHTFPMASSTASPSGRNLPSQLQHLSEEQGRWVEPGRGIRTGVQLLVVNECLTMLINTQHSSPFELTEYFTLPSEHLESQLKYQDSSPEPFAQPHWQQPPCLLSSIESWINWVQHNCMPVCNSVSQTVQHGTTAANHKHDRPLPNSEAAIWEMVKGDAILTIFNELSTRVLGKYEPAQSTVQQLLH